MTTPNPTTSLKGRSFVKELDFTPDEWRSLLERAQQLKLELSIQPGRQRLAEANIAVIFEKASTRTRCAFEVAAHQQGAHVTYLDPSGSHMGHKESAKDSARVLGRMFDAIEYRGFSQATVETLVDYAGVPVWNGLTDEWHPTQSLCDMLTMREHAGKPDHEIAFAYVGDAHNNVANSLLVAGALMGMDVRMVRAACNLLQPARGRRGGPCDSCARQGARITLTDDPASGVDGVDFVYTDVWVSMGEAEESWQERIDSAALPGEPDAARQDRQPRRAVHALPPRLPRPPDRHGRTVVPSTGLATLEVTDDVFESGNSIVFDQAENRMHTIKAVMVATLGSMRSCASSSLSAATPCCTAENDRTPHRSSTTWPRVAGPLAELAAVS